MRVLNHSNKQLMRVIYPAIDVADLTIQFEKENEVVCDHEENYEFVKILVPPIMTPVMISSEHTISD